MKDNSSGKIDLEGRKLCVIKKGVGGPVIYLGLSRENEEALASIASAAAEMLTEKNFILAGFISGDWLSDFSPWKAEKSPRAAFAGGGEYTLKWLENYCMPYIEKEYITDSSSRKSLIAGYSLAGLFSLWAFYESGIFQGAASCSGSLWHPGWESYIGSHSAKTQGAVYLSLGRKEERTNDPVFSLIGRLTQQTYEAAAGDTNITNCKFELHDGGHSHRPEWRMAKAIAWLVENC